MITTEEIAVRVYQLLQKSQVKNLITGTIDYERSDYSKEDVIIVPHLSLIHIYISRITKYLDIFLDIFFN